MKTNNKGFTLIELLATIVLLAIVASIGTYSIVHVVTASKEKNYNLLIKNIKSAAEVYYQECRYNDKEKNIVYDINTGTFGEYDGTKCNIYKDANNDGYVITLGDMVSNGYLTGNTKNDSGYYKIVNPNNADENYENCIIGVKYDTGAKKTIVIADPTNMSPDYCPKNYGG